MQRTLIYTLRNRIDGSTHMSIPADTVLRELDSLETFPHLGVFVECDGGTPYRVLTVHDSTPVVETPAGVMPLF